MILATELHDQHIRADERALLAYALQRGGAGAVEVCALVRPFELSNPWLGELLALIGERLTKSLAVDEESLIHVAMANRMRFGDPLEFAALADLDTGKPRTTSELGDLAARIRERHMLRRVREAAGALADIAAANPSRLDGDALPWEASEATARVGQFLLELVAPTAASEESGAGEAAEEAAEERKQQRAEGRPLALTTGHVMLNELLAGGFRPGELIVIAGATSMGKTSLALGMACELAEANRRVGIVSLEMPRGEVGDRLLARVGGADLRAIRTGALDDDADTTSWREYLQALDLQVWHPPVGATMSQIAAKAMSWRAKGLSMLVVDHLGRVKPEGDARLRYDLQVGSIAKGCKSLALTLRIPVLLLVQLNRAGSSRLEEAKAKARAKGAIYSIEWWHDSAVPMPQLSDLKESSAIEQEADVVLFPVRGTEVGVDQPDAGCILVAKQRNGPKGVVPAIWQPHTASYLCETRRGER